jgi:MurNAc alpha-1-phosphate uridylyltransferase
MLKSAAREGRLAGSLYEGLWEDVGTPERLAALNQS